MYVVDFGTGSEIFLKIYTFSLIDHVPKCPSSVLKFYLQYSILQLQKVSIFIELDVWESDL